MLVLGFPGQREEKKRFLSCVGTMLMLIPYLKRLAANRILAKLRPSTFTTPKKCNGVSLTDAGELQWGWRDEKETMYGLYRMGQWDGIGQDGMELDGITWNWMGWNRMAWDGMELDGMDWMGWNWMGWDGTG